VPGGRVFPWEKDLENCGSERGVFGTILSLSLSLSCETLERRQQQQQQQ
jgi:hypothetical protein